MAGGEERVTEIVINGYYRSSLFSKNTLGVFGTCI